MALLFVDVDNFKSINDTLGHSFGDRVLQHIAERLRAAAGTNGLLARLGGDEFTLLLENVKSHEQVEAHAAEIVATLQQPLIVDGRVLTTSASVGASLYPDHAADAEGLLRAADVALFRAKELGRNRFTLYSPPLYDAAAQRFRLEQSLRRAVEGGELLLMYQPQVSLHTFEANAHGGAAALAQARWPHRHRHGVRPHRREDRPHPRAHRLDPALGGHHRGRLARPGLARAPASRSTSRRRSSSRATSSSTWRARSSSRGLPPSALELEITETVFQTGPAIVESLRRLRALGVAIALDDFGIGYSSLTSLEQLPITRVKLDRLLIAGVDSNPRSAAIVRSIVALCHGLGLQVVAEGVERATQLEFLSHCGPIGVQGYLLAQPVEAAAAAAEAQAAAVRAREALEATQRLPRDSGEALVFATGPRRRLT